jgi:hypothetical protein
MGFTKNHPLEGEGCRRNFFSYLLRPSGATSAPDVNIPATVMFEHGYPRWWYHYDSKAREVRRSAGGKDLHTESIKRFFVDQAPRLAGKLIDVIAVYTYIFDHPATDEPCVAVEYYDAASLEAFLMTANDPRKKEGFLQQLVSPGEAQYTVVNAMWGPKVCIVRRRASTRGMADNRASIRDRFVTFDGPEYFSAEVKCAVETKEKVAECCRRVADHLSKTQHLHVDSMQAYFVIDARGAAMLLWCGSLYFAAPPPIDAPLSADASVLNIVQRHRAPVLPPTLLQTPTFTQPASCEDGDAAMLDSLDGAQLRQNALARGKVTSMHTDLVRARRAAAAGKINTTKQLAAVQQETAAERGAAIMRQRYAQWFTVSEDVQSEYEALLAAERAAKVMLADVFYYAHSYYADDGHTKAELSVDLPVELPGCFGGNGAAVVAELIAAVHLAENPDGSVVIPPPAQRHGNPVAFHPISKIATDADMWIGRHFERRRRVLRRRCLPAVAAAAALECMAPAMVPAMAPAEPLVHDTRRRVSPAMTMPTLTISD